MTSALLGVALVLGWSLGPAVARWVWVGDAAHPPTTRPVRAAGAVAAAGITLALVRRFSEYGPVAGQGLNPTAVALLALLAWLVRLQAQRAGHALPAPADRAVRVTTAALIVGALVLAVPDLFLLASN